MAESDWTVATNSLNTSALARGVTNGIARPNGGGNFLYGFNSLDTSSGATILFANQANFAPNASGGRITGAVKRGVSGGPTGFSPFLVIGMQGAAITDNGYILGLSDDDPYRIILRKGQLSLGAPADEIGSGGVLAASEEAFSNDTWHHLRIDMIVNGTGDVILKCFESDLSVVPISTPIWEPIPGLENFVDDALGVNSGSPPYTSSRFGFGMQTADVTRRAYFDHIQVFRQL